MDHTWYANSPSLPYASSHLLSTPQLWSQGVFGINTTHALSDHILHHCSRLQKALHSYTKAKSAFLLFCMEELCGILNVVDVVMPISFVRSILVRNCFLRTTQKSSLTITSLSPNKIPSVVDSFSVALCALNGPPETHNSILYSHDAHFIFRPLSLYAQQKIAFFFFFLFERYDKDKVPTRVFVCDSLSTCAGNDESTVSRHLQQDHLLVSIPHSWMILRHQ